MLKSRSWQLPHSPQLLSHRRIVYFLITLVFLVSVFMWRNAIADSFSLKSDAQPQGSAPGGDPIFNRTLGFQDIFALVLPHRRDRAGALLGAADATNITLTIYDAVADANATKEDIPLRYGQNGWTPSPGQLGCFASHHRIWKKMVDENIASSLVVESDADWDMRIKSSLQGLASGVKAIMESMPSTSAFQSNVQHPRLFSSPPRSIGSPYGDGWDLLWIGHCGSQAERYYAYHDPSAASSEHSWSMSPPPPEIANRPGTTRLIFQLSDSSRITVVCTAGYAISNRGAQKLVELYPDADHEADLWLGGICVNEPGMVCISSFPQFISAVQSSPSNIDYDYKEEEKIEAKEKIAGAPGIQISARANGALGLARKGPGEWRKEWEDSPLWALDNGAVKEEVAKEMKVESK